MRSRVCAYFFSQEVIEKTPNWGNSKKNSNAYIHFNDTENEEYTKMIFEKLFNSIKEEIDEYNYERE